MNKSSYVPTTIFFDNLIQYDYQQYGLTFGATGSLEQFLFNDKMDIIDAGGIYLYGARFYDPAIERFMTEDTSTGSLEDPQSQNRYIYSRDNPLTITDINGHGWFKSLTHAVSNAVSDIATGVNDVSSAATNLASDASNTWNSLPPGEQKAIVVTTVVAAAAVASVATLGIASPIAAAAISATISSASYTASTQSHATGVGALTNAAFGAIAGGAGAVGSIGDAVGTTASRLVIGHALAAMVGAGVDAAQSEAIALETNTAPSFDPLKLAMDAGFATLGFHLGIKESELTWGTDLTSNDPYQTVFTQEETSFENQHPIVSSVLLPITGATATATAAYWAPAAGYDFTW